MRCLVGCSCSCAVMMRNYSVLIMRTKTTPEDSNRNDRTRIMNKDSVANEENIILNSWQTIPSNTYHDSKFLAVLLLKKSIINLSIYIIKPENKIQEITLDEF